jgi:3-dehydroquinate synthase
MGSLSTLPVTSVTVRAGGNQYQATVGPGLLDDVGSIIAKQIAPSRCAIISDTNIAPIFGERVEKSLTSAGFEPTVITIPTGEQSKTLEQVGMICDEMLSTGLDRQSFVIGLGGGVIGDISGFVAAIFQRGIPHVQIPTTLLAMVDSSIGGKTGVNTPAGKNLLGAVHQPALVIDDVDLLKTLPARELNQGFAEIIKHGIITNEMLEQFKSWKGMTPRGLQPLIQRNIEIKARIVAKDEMDRTGERALLNFGHTVGHAIERAGNYKTFLHGEAIALGIVAACDISMKRAGLPKIERTTIVDILRRFELPTNLPPNFPREKILAALQHDKKFERGKIRFVVISTIGSAKLSSDVTLEDIREAVAAL